MIPVNEPLLDGDELRLLRECIESGWISSEGPFVARFEEQFASRVGRHHGIAVANGTAALEIAVAALEVGPGDEVIMPTFTIISCAGAVVRAGAVPVVVDADPLTWNMRSEDVEARVTPRTRAIMAVHIYGLPVDMNPLLEVAKRHGVALIEDAAQMHGQTYKGRPCGSFGDVSTFSFYPNKHITTGEGGMVVTDRADIAEAARSLRNLCFQPKKRFVHERLGWNYRMTNLQAALGLAQLARLETFVERKRRMGARYTAELQPLVPHLQLPPARTSYAENIYWVYGIVLGDEIPLDASEAMARLAHRGIGCRPFFWPMHEQPVLKRMGLFDGERCPIAERLARRGFYLPSGLTLRDEQMQSVVDGLTTEIGAMV
jgi:perosamine synthetase